MTSDQERRHLEALTLLPEEDDHHPLSVLGRWTLMIAEDYGDELPLQLTLSWCADYLDRKLGKVAQDDGQDFPLLARELRKCRAHLETVLHDSRSKERGAPCPECSADGKFVRLTLEFGHYCDDEDCDKINYDSDEADRWVCPRNRLHVWTEREYRNWVEERTGGRSA